LNFLELLITVCKISYFQLLGIVCISVVLPISGILLKYLCHFIGGSKGVDISSCKGKKLINKIRTPLSLQTRVPFWSENEQPNSFATLLEAKAENDRF